ncbi:MAG: hypothetical protein H0V56_11130 [Chthoniobacterales bacterium]|nr:hypothetical protein [Chthoniobacterales bacterium]
MIKRSALPVLACLSLCLTMHAQPTGQPERTALALQQSDIYRSVDSAALVRGLPMLALLDGRPFPLSHTAWTAGMAPLDSLPLAFVGSAEVQRGYTGPMTGSAGPGGVVDLRLKRGYDFGGEVGLFYGKSSGKYGREDFSAHIISGVENEFFSITVGAAYHESSGRINHRQRR